MRIAFTTLGCKINQYETDLLREDFQSRGNTIVPFDTEADVYVINTCSVTGKSDYQSRQIIRSAIKRGQGAKIVVTGCYASTRPEEIKKISGVDFVVRNEEKSRIPDRISSQTADFQENCTEPPAFPAKSVKGRTRAYLKIQDGCNNHCAYCIIPSARGASRSATPEQVISEFASLVERNCPEIVLTGIHIGTYGSDLAPESSLSSLVGKLLSRRDKSRLRLSSIEVNEITPEMIGYLGHGLCRHLHIPLQSGDGAILSSMGRNYTPEFYLETLADIAKQVPGMALGADVIVGYPGEGEKEFQNTVNLVKQSALTHLHVFSYSPRPGTPASSMKSQVPEAVKKERNAVLRSVGREKNFEFRKSCLGNELKVVLEDKAAPATGLPSGLTDNYIRVTVSDGLKEQIGKEITVRLDNVNEEQNLATVYQAFV